MPITDQVSPPPRVVKDVRRNTNLVKWARQLHLWLGVLFAPAIIFFAFTGALQTFSWHETQPGSTYQPPVWIQKLAQIHKKQTAQIRQRPQSAVPQKRRVESEAARPKVQPPLTTIFLKWFTFLMSLGLIVTSLLGVYMAFQYNRDRRMIWALLVFGTVLPVLVTR